MAAIRVRAGEDVLSMIDRVKLDHHYMLSQCGVRIGAEMAARPDGDDRPPLYHRGRPVPVAVRRVSLAYRLQGAPDAIVAIDADRWKSGDAAGRAALIDHALCQIEVRLTEEGEPILDQAGRPVLIPRPADLEISVYDEVIERHGRASYDLRQLELAAGHPGLKAVESEVDQ